MPANQLINSSKKVNLASPGKKMHWKLVRGHEWAAVCKNWIANHHDKGQGRIKDVTADRHLLQNTQILTTIPFHKPSDYAFTFTIRDIITIDPFTGNFFESIHLSRSDIYAQILILNHL